jgi:hypothetical protein
MGDIADDCLAALMDMDMFHSDLLLATRAVTLQSLQLCREGPSEFIQGTLIAVVFLDGLCSCHAPGAGHSRIVNSNRLQSGGTSCLPSVSLNKESRENIK